MRRLVGRHLLALPQSPPPPPTPTAPRRAAAHPRWCARFVHGWRCGGAPPTATTAAPRPAPPHRRPLSAAAATPQVVFDTAFKALQRDNIARVCARQLDAGLLDDATEFDYLRDEVAHRLVERLADIEGSQASFSRAADLGCWSGHVRRALERHQADPAHRAVVTSLAHHDQSQGMLRLAERRAREEAQLGLPPSATLPEPHPAPLLDASYHHLPDCAGGTEDLGLEDGSLDIVFSSLWLHWCNNLPALLTQVRRALRPDGLFLGAMLGGDTLSELRSSLVVAEQEVAGGVSPRMSPLVHVGDVGMLLQGAGFSIPTVDTDLITVEYPDARALLRHLQGMGETNAAVLRQQGPLRRAVLDRACEYYHDTYGDPSDGSVPATFQVIYMIGWHGAGGSRPMARGTADVSLTDLKQQLAGVEVIPSGSPPTMDGGGGGSSS